MLKKYFTSENFLILGCCFLAIGIPGDGFMRGFENVGIMAILMSAILNYKAFDRKTLFQPFNIALYILFALCVFGYLYVDNIHELNAKVALKILFVLFPIGFAAAPKITEATKRLSFILFLFATALLALLTCIDYFMHFEAYNILIQQSKPIQIIGGTMHIYFSMMLALSIFLGLYLLNQNFKLIISGWLDKLILLSIIINLLALHILSARTGLMAFYITLVVLLIRFTWITKRYKTLIGGVFAMGIFPLIMYLAIPSVKNRIDNTYEDLHRYFSGDYVGYYSISGRFETWKVAYRIFQEHKLFGIGSGDLQQEIETQFLIDGSRLMREESLPNCHNQYIEMLATHGLVGFLVFIALLYFVTIEVKRMPHNKYLMLCFIALFISGFLVESLLEREAGITLFLFFFFVIKNSAYDSEKYTAVAP